MEECFNIDESAPSNKKTRGISYGDVNLAILLMKNWIYYVYWLFDDFFIGLRNLNTNNKIGKEKVIEDNGLEIMHEEDRESQEEDVLPILHDNNNISEYIDIDIDLGNNMNDWEENVIFLAWYFFINFFLPLNDWE